MLKIKSRWLAVGWALLLIFFTATSTMAQVNTPAESGTCTDNNLVVIADGQAVAPGTKFVREKLHAPLTDQAAEGSTLVSTVCSVQPSNGQLQFHTPVEICIPLNSPEALTAAGGRRDNLRVGIFSNNVWQPLPPAASGNGLQTEVCGATHNLPAAVSEFGVMAMTPVTVPETGAPISIFMLRLFVFGLLGTTVFGGAFLWQLWTSRKRLNAFG